MSVRHNLLRSIPVTVTPRGRLDFPKHVLTAIKRGLTALLHGHGFDLTLHYQSGTFTIKEIPADKKDVLHTILGDTRTRWWENRDDSCTAIPYDSRPVVSWTIHIDLSDINLTTEDMSVVLKTGTQEIPKLVRAQAKGKETARQNARESAARWAQWEAERPAREAAERQERERQGLIRQQEDDAKEAARQVRHDRTARIAESISLADDRIVNQLAYTYGECTGEEEWHSEVKATVGRVEEYPTLVRGWGVHLRSLRAVAAHPEVIQHLSDWWESKQVPPSDSLAFRLLQANHVLKEGYDENDYSIQYPVQTIQHAWMLRWDLAARLADAEISQPKES